MRCERELSPIRNHELPTEMLMLNVVVSSAAAMRAPTVQPTLRYHTAVRMKLDSFSSSDTAVPDANNPLQTPVPTQAELVCARGVCVVPDDDMAPEECIILDDGSVSCTPSTTAPKPGFTVDYLWPRGLLLVSSVL